MLDGWYCRTLANEQAAATHPTGDDNDLNDGNSASSESQDEPTNYSNQVDFKTQYKYLKRKLKYLLYENEFFQDALRTNQRRFLKISRDRSFLLDRLLQYEKPDVSTSETEETESSDESPRAESKKRKLEMLPEDNTPKFQPAKKRNKMESKLKAQSIQMLGNKSNTVQEGHMTAEEVERHLQSRQSITELVPEKAPPTVPNEMFSNEPSLDSESNDQLVETSPSNIGEECLSVDNVIKCEYNP